MSTQAQNNAADLQDPLLDSNFDPDLDEYLVYHLDKELESERDFSAGDVVACLQYRATLAEPSRRLEPFLKMALRSAGVITATVPMLNAIVQGVPIEILADSGASYSILSSEMALKVAGPTWRQRVSLTGFQPRFELADGSFAGSVGKLSLPIRFRRTDKPVMHNFFVIEARSSMAILGVNFFMRAGAVLDFVKQRIVFRRLHRVKAVPFKIRRSAETIRGAQCPVFLEHDVILTAGQVADTMGHLEDTDPLIDGLATGFLEGPDWRGDGEPLLAACVTKFDRKDRAPVRLVNDTKETVTLAKGSLIGRFTPVPVVPDDPRYVSEECCALRLTRSEVKSSEDGQRRALDEGKEGKDGPNRAKNPESAGPSRPERKDSQPEENPKAQRARFIRILRPPEKERTVVGKNLELVHGVDQDGNSTQLAITTTSPEEWAKIGEENKMALESGESNTTPVPALAESSDDDTSDEEEDEEEQDSGNKNSELSAERQPERQQRIPPELRRAREWLQRIQRPRTPHIPPHRGKYGTHPERGRPSSHLNRATPSTRHLANPLPQSKGYLKKCGRSSMLAGDASERISMSDLWR